MQSPDHLTASMEASLKQAQSDAMHIDVAVTKLIQGAPFSEKMPRLRKLLASLNKAVHEANAYNNVLVTGGNTHGH